MLSTSEPGLSSSLIDAAAAVVEAWDNGQLVPLNPFWDIETPEKMQALREAVSAARIEQLEHRWERA